MTPPGGSEGSGDERGPAVAGTPLGAVAHAAVRGAIAALAMTGMRVLTVELGLVEQTPPQAIARQRAQGVLRKVPRKRRRAAIELAHWGYGGMGGALFGMLPQAVRRRRRWVGPIYGLLLWLGFETGIALLLGLARTSRRRVAERVALAGDHLLYGIVLSEIRARPRG